MNIHIIVPAFNEEKSIGSVIASLKRGGYNNIVVVDDCSTDSTGEVAFVTGAYVLTHIVNRGQGAALKTGIDYAITAGTDVIVTFDSDGQHRVEDIEALLAPIRAGEVDVTIGSRFLQGHCNVPPLRRIVLFGGKIFLRLMYGIKITDSQCGIRAFSSRAARNIDITMDRMEHASEILEQIFKKNIRYKEIPVTIDYTEYSKAKGQSNLNSFAIAFKLIMTKLSGG